jgi:hypothetical protein
MKHKRVSTRIFCALLIAAWAIGCSGTDTAGPTSAEETSLLQVASAPASAPITSEETADLIYIRELEKLARDVYTVMDQQWGKSVFENIAVSEQRHMDAILRLLGHYSIADPVGTNGPGVFANEELGILYTELVERGKISLEEAYLVGVLIEETDIEDLNSALARTEKRNIELVYENLLNASENHLSSFNKLLD